MNYKATFTGREVNAIGKFYSIETICTGDNEEKARLNLYDRYDHITGLTLKETIETNWNNIDLNSSESELQLIDGLTFETLLLEIACNIQNINAETVRDQFNTDLQNRIREAKEIFEANLKNIVKHAQTFR